MSFISGRLGRLLAGASTIVALSATLTLAPSATAVEPDGPHFGEPVVGQCHNYTAQQGNGMSDFTPVVECTSAHTARVIAVVQLPPDLTWDSPMNQLGAVVDRKCEPVWEKTVGGTEVMRRMTAYTEYFFFPSAAQKEHGARWIRCDINLLGHASLLPLPVNSKPLPSPGRVPYAVTRCMYGSQFLYTACSKSHNHRATGGFRLADGPYPGDSAIERAAMRRCPGLTTSRHWRYVHPTRETWVKYGSRIIICYSQTTH